MKYICTHCGVEKDELYFSRISGRKRKVASWCKECHKNNRETAKNREKKVPTTKKCSMCKKEKNINDFYKNKCLSTGHTSACKECINIKNKEWRTKNSEVYKIAVKKSSEKRKLEKSVYDKEYRKKNIEKIKEYKRKQYLRYKKEIEEGVRDKQVKNKERVSQYFKDRRKNDVDYKLRCAVRGRLRRYIKSKSASKNVVELTGCDIEKLREHIEKQFRDGMSWENYGDYRNNGWNIDHIKPCAVFDFTKEDQLKECFHYTNLQPLWWYENISKGRKWEKN